MRLILTYTCLTKTQMIMNRKFRVTLALMLIAILCSGNLLAQDNKKKKRGFFKELASGFKEALMGPPGAIDKNTVGKYYAAFTQKDSQDSSIIKLVNDTSKHIAFTSSLSKYDPYNGGFYLNTSLFSPPALKTSSHDYYFIFNNLAEFRFLKVSNRSIKYKFNTELIGNNVNVGR